MGQTRADMPRLDMEIDPFRANYQPIADAYDAYMDREYWENYEQRKDEWDFHYNKMRTATEAWIARYIQKLQPMPVAIMAAVGVGTETGKRDYDERLVTSMLSQLRGLILVDFSAKTNRRAFDSMNRDAGMPKDRMRMFQHDITHGLSTHYHEILSEVMNGSSDIPADSEENLARIAAILGHKDIESEIVVREDAFSQSIEKPGAKQISHPRATALLAQLKSASDVLLPRSGGTPVSLDLISFNMVLAGSGAATEGIFWDRFYASVQSTDSELSGKIPNSLEKQRKETLINMHNCIMRYNTMVAKNAIEEALVLNPQSRVLAITDHSTRYLRPDLAVGELPRLDLPELKAYLALKGIEMNHSELMKPWYWHDEKEHEHGVVAITAKLLDDQSGTA